MLGEKPMYALWRVFAVCKAVIGKVKPGRELTCCFLQLQVIGKGPDTRGPAAFKVSKILTDSQNKARSRISWIQDLQELLMRTLLADGKVELIRGLPLATVIVRPGEPERGNGKKSPLPARKPPCLRYSEKRTGKDQTSEGQLPATGFLEDGIPYIECKRALDIS